MGEPWYGALDPRYSTGPIGPTYRLPPGFRSMARIASRPQVVEVESQLRLLLDWNLMISMQVAIAASEGPTQFSQHLLHRWSSESGFLEYSYDLWLPIAIDTSPAVALEAENPQPAVVRVVSAFGA
jgi:hypothetical protein